MIKRILSFDCANRSLAVCCVTINIHDNKDTNSCNWLIGDHVKINTLKVFDLTKGKKVNTVDRASLLKKCLTDIDIMLLDEDLKINTVLVEYQMSANDKSRCVSQQILYHYSCLPGVNVELIGPTLKNKVCFSSDSSLEHGTFMAKYASKYTANKNHSKSNFLYWIKRQGISKLIQENNIPKKNVDDVADAFMQICGWLIFGKG